MKYYRQETKYTCGPACIRMILSLFNIRISEYSLRLKLKTNKVKGTGKGNWLLINDLVPIRTEENLTVGNIRDLLKDKYGICVAITRKNDLPHYIVIKEIINDDLIINDPYYGENIKLSIVDFIDIWYTDTLFISKNFTVIVGPINEI